MGCGPPSRSFRRSTTTPTCWPAPDAGHGLADVLTESSATRPDRPQCASTPPTIGRSATSATCSDRALRGGARGRPPQRLHGARRAALDDCRLEAMFVDDGFRPAGTISLTEHAALVGCPVRRIVRIETEAEAASVGWPPLAECRAHFQQAIADALADGAIGLKTIAAYRCGLDLPTPSPDAAAPPTTHGSSRGPPACRTPRWCRCSWPTRSRRPARRCHSRCTAASATETRR